MVQKGTVPFRTIFSAGHLNPLIPQHLPQLPQSLFLYPVHIPLIIRVLGGDDPDGRAVQVEFLQHLPGIRMGESGEKLPGLLPDRLQPDQLLHQLPVQFLQPGLPGLPLRQATPPSEIGMFTFCCWYIVASL